VYHFDLRDRPNSNSRLASRKGSNHGDDDEKLANRSSKPGENHVYEDSKKQDLGVNSFVECMTIDYRKTLNEYKNKIMDDVRKKAQQSNLYQ